MISEKAINQNVSDQTKKLEFLKLNSLKHPYFLGKYVLGYDKLELIHYELLSYILKQIEWIMYPDRLKEDVCKRIEECLDLEPRGCYKTTAISVILVMWIELKRPDIKILVNHKVNGSSKAILEEIREHYNTNYLFIQLFGKRIGHISRSGFIVSAYRTKPAKEATISAGSVDKEAVGGHFDIMINDDIVTLKDYVSEKERKKTEVFYVSLKYLAEDGIIVNVGTRWHEEDLYGTVIIPSLPDACKRIKPIIDENKVLYFETKYPLDKIEKLRRGGDYLDDEPGANSRLSGMLFNAVMMQKPESDKASKPFRTLKKIKQDDVGVYLRAVAYYDPAFSANASSCFNAIPCIATDQYGTRVLRDVMYKKLTADELVKGHLPGFLKANDIGVFIYESNAAQRLLQKHLEDMMSLHNINCQIVSINNVANKHLRIMAAQPTIVSELYIIEEKLKDTYSEYAQAVVELTNYSKEAEYRDFTDALAGCVSYTENGEVGVI
jgi:hypothetical protein